MVFLGIIDEKIKIIDHHEQCSWLDNKLGLLLTILKNLLNNLFSLYF